MRLGRVIGRVTLSVVVPQLQGARWLVISPYTRDNFQKGSQPPEGVSPEPSLVAYDSLGGGVGDTVGFVEGREAAQPFDVAPPIDAITAALVDTVYYNPKPVPPVS